MTNICRLLILQSIAIAAFCFGPTSVSHAAGIGFKNDVKNAAILIQGASKFNGMIRRGQPIVLLPGRTGFDPNIPPGLRQITIIDANQPNRILLRQTIPVPPTNQNLYFSIQEANAPGPFPLRLVPLVPRGQ